MTNRDQQIASLREQRLGQLIENVYGHSVDTSCLFYTEDVEVIKTMLAAKLADKLGGVGHGH